MGSPRRRLNRLAAAFGPALPGAGDRQPTLRLGLRMVKGLSLECGARVAAARAQQPFASVE
ncbi:MAG: hypothetical protein M1541_00500, partial [Acidobacteria bacterium]|nr:hypothetical protein [Acidobacteriota bacterium]